jgi:uncharacterized protein YecE (DUF72 family)
MSKSWARRVQANPRFKFTAKLYRNFTHSRESLIEADEGTFKSGLAPLMEADRLGTLLVQFPYSFHNKEENLDYVKDLAGRFKEYPLVLEIRHASWDRAPAYRFMREIGMGFCNIDQPQVSFSIGPTKTVTSKIGYLRLHGRNVKDWFREDAGRDARYDYLYNEFELFEISERIRSLAKEAEEVYVITNNHYRGKAVTNALELKAKLGEKNPKVPEVLLEHYPQLQELLEAKE